MKSTELKLGRFAYQVDTLTAYVDEQSLELLTAATFEGETGKMFQKQTGIKSAADLHLFEVDVYVQAEGADCAFTPSGNQEFTARRITVGKMKIDDEYCPKKLEAYWTQMALSKGSTYDTVAFESDWTAYLTKKINQRVEQMYWQSSLTTGSGDFAHFDGFLQIIKTAIGAGLPVNGNTGSVAVGTGIVAGNVVAIFDAMWAAVPAQLLGKEGFKFFTDWSIFRTYVTALKNANMYHYDGVSGNAMATGEITIPGTNFVVKAMHGMGGSGATYPKIVGGLVTNFFIGTDLEGEEDKFILKDNPITDTIMLKVKFKLGTQIAFPTEIVQFTFVP